KEDDPMGGHDPYSNSKGCAELVTAAYRNSFFPLQSYGKHGVSVSSVRAGNVFGGGDWSDYRLIPDIMKAARDQRPVVIRNPGAVRPWQYVLEPLNGYLTLAENQWRDGAAFAEGWNFGPDEEGARSVSWVAQKIGDLWGEGLQVQSDSGQNPPEAQLLKLDCSKARNRLGWKPKSDISTGLQWTIQWYRDFHRGTSARELCEQAINVFQST
ncbi:MAG: CDP-glucose 4,6-dehydratase, partial [Nitrospinaceae bacterium]|nr:CDP-glucose 4,6-dehydratase [Nitrospinaceae bacterium]NIR55303.1 CDP-glucose 4,6-dehydratase [Nitrospinaceae bacterium]NIS85742.1 CDP-glucose 4,6-dehydratase [Nitrospinaceae bacterium]NIT82592.1 CDP-glucose 4,6-dehydratase [Nitrospinaceae bacterium]NIU44797.1 CDP-glucose 4,6-dehydratase [Nitrospinaceae bacterium]